MRLLILLSISKVYVVDADGILEVDILFDYKSHANVCFVIEYEAGFVLDFEFVCNFCTV